MCGRRFSYKVIEERPGGAQDLQDHLNKNFLSTHPAGNSQGGVSNVRFWRRYVRSLFSGSGMQSNEQQLSTLPTHTQPSAKLVAPQIQQAAATLEDPRFLHIAMRDSTFTRAPTLSSEESSGLTTDIELFSLLWDRYERCAAQRWSLLPWKLRKKLLRPPMRMRFIQVFKPHEPLGQSFTDICCSLIYSRPRLSVTSPRTFPLSRKPCHHLNHQNGCFLLPRILESLALP